MRKLLSTLSSLTLLTASIASVTACSADKGQLVPFYIYNNGEKFKHAPVTSENIDDATRSGKNAAGEEFEYSTLKGAGGLANNVMIPALYGLNLTSDNHSGHKGGNWTEEQINSGIQAQKNNILSSTSGDSNKLWNDFYNNYSTTDDNYYTQVAIVQSENTALQSGTEITSRTANIEKTGNKDWIETVPGHSGVQIKPSLKVLSPIKEAIDWLNDPTNNLNAGVDKTDEDFLNQSARYALVSIPNVVMTYEFSSPNNYWSFQVNVKNITALIYYLTFKDPNSSTDSTTYAHQWFFYGYAFYDFTKYQDNDYQTYNYHQFANNVTLALGWGTTGKKTGEDGLLSKDEANNIKAGTGSFKYYQSDYTIPDLKWDIIPDSIRANY